VTLGISLAAGLVITHSVIPPTPGPVGVAGLFGVNVGSLILWGIIVAIPMTIAAIIYAKYIGKKIYQIPTEDGLGWERSAYEEPTYDLMDFEDDPNLPSTFLSFLPIAVPILLILVNTITSAMKLKGAFMPTIEFLGSPVIAVGIGLIVAIYGLAGKYTKEETIDHMERGIKT